MKILITGGSGQLGQYLNAELSKQHEILTVYNSIAGNCKNYNSIKLDLLDRKKLAKVFRDFKPDVVIHAAALSSPIVCEQVGYETTMAFNSGLTGMIAQECELMNAKVIFFSTDLVYDGEQGSFLKEDSLIRPVTVYAESKVEGERAVKENCSRHVILRTALLIGMAPEGRSNNFTETVQNLINGRGSDLFYDQFRTPLTLAEASRLIRKILSVEDVNGTFNFGGKERVSRSDIGYIICNIAGADKELINKISMNDFLTVKMVRDVSLDTKKLNALGIEQMSFEEMVKDEFKDFNSQWDLPGKLK